MTRKAKPAKKLDKPNPNAVPVAVRPGEDVATKVAQTFLRPTVQAACTVRAFSLSDGDGPEVRDLIAELSDQAESVVGGDLKRAEAMLISQAHALDAIFGYCARRSVRNFGEYLNAAETYLRLALKAQGQCRATLETLAAIKNPATVAFVRQANIAAGPQQVNNGVTRPEGSHARELEIAPSKLLGGQDGERLDTGTTSAAGGADSQLAALGKGDRT